MLPPPDDEILDFELGLPAPELRLRGLHKDTPLPPEVLWLRRGDFGDVCRFSTPALFLFFAAAFACRKAIARVPRTNLGEVTGELFPRGFVI